MQKKMTISLLRRKSRCAVSLKAQYSDTGSVRSIDRAMLMLEALGSRFEGWRVTDVAIETGVPLSTAHRILVALERRRFVHFDTTNRLWHVGHQAFAIGNTFLRSKHFVGFAQPYLRRLRNQTRETASLGAAYDGEIVVLAQAESREITRAVARAGGKAPMASCGLGRAILASYSDEDVAATIRKLGSRAAISRSMATSSSIGIDLAEIRRDGYAIDNEEAAKGLRCVAAPVYDSQGEVLAAISISGSKLRLPPERVLSLGKLVRETAFDLTRELGGRPP
jgi:IclR family acetate operon transcriptional repressor